MQYKTKAALKDVALPHNNDKYLPEMKNDGLVLEKAHLKNCENKLEAKRDSTCQDTTPLISNACLENSADNVGPRKIASTENTHPS